MQKIIFFLGSLILLSFGMKLSKSSRLTPFEFERPRNFPPMPVSAENPTTLEGAELGRYLFYDPVLSRDSTISCASCHRQEFAFSDSPNKFSEGIDGAKTERNTPSLFNLAWYPAMFWDGRASSIEQQVFFPVRDHNEMDLDWRTVEKRIYRSRFYPEMFNKVFGDTQIDSVRIAFAIAQFERTLISYNSKFDKVIRGEERLTKQELRGFEVMNDQSMADCLHCHSTDANGLATNLQFSNNGLDNAQNVEVFKDPGLGKVTGNKKDYGHFKVPSLRNIALTAPYMHDGRFQSLDEVINFYSEGLNNNITIDSRMTHVHQGGVQLTDEDKSALKAFLLTLTDSTFISDPRFGNPFENKSKDFQD